MAQRLLFGAAKLDITPDSPIPLGGFAGREGPYSGIGRRLHLRAFWFSVADSSALLVVADIIWWPPEHIDRLRKAIAFRWPVAESHIILHATHTHSAPQPSTAFLPSIGLADTEWVERLIEQLFLAIELAWNRKVPATIERGRGRSQIALNRRVVRGDERPTKQHPYGRIDDELIVLRVSAITREPIAVLAHYACHPTVNRGPMLTADFPGAFCEQLEDSYGNSTIVGFLQGCCGDIKPNVERNPKTLESGFSEVERLGNRLMAEVDDVLQRPMDQIHIDRIHAQTVAINLRLQRLPGLQELISLNDEPGVTGEWSRFLLDHPERLSQQVPMEFSHVRLGSDLGLLAVNAELTTPYGLEIKARSGRTIMPLPYSNGMIGYVTTAGQIREGGYEPIQSTPYFALPSPFALDVEQRFYAALSHLELG